MVDSAWGGRLLQRRIEGARIGESAARERRTHALAWAVPALTAHGAVNARSHPDPAGSPALTADIAVNAGCRTRNARRPALTRRITRDRCISSMRRLPLTRRAARDPFLVDMSAPASANERTCAEW
jgi:hypothetical protein